MRAARWLWRELTRPRGPVRHRFYRVRRRSNAGVALLMTITSIMLLTVLVTEIAHGAVVRIQLAGHHRNEVKAQALAVSGVQFYRLILMLSKSLGKNPMVAEFGAALGVNGDSLWQLMPMLNTGLMRMIFVTDGDIDAEDAAELVTAGGGLTDEEIEESRESSLLGRNFLDFDGDFSAEVFDEGRYIYVGKFEGVTDLATLLESHNAKEVLGLMDKDDHREWLYDHSLDKIELVANLADWTDPDDTRIFRGGSEDSLYQKLEPPYEPKNGPFDTRQEIRLVDGWHLEGVWERFGHHLTIYGNGRVNVNSAKRPVIRAILSAYAEVSVNDTMLDLYTDELLKYRGMPRADGGIHFTSPQMFESFVEGNLVGLPLRDEIKGVIATEAQVFRIRSTGEVGEARAEIIAIIDYSQDPSGRIKFWRTL